MKTLNRTPAQSRAARPEHNVWVSANAGTGKTRVLVDRIARLLLDGARPEKILCLTFTKTGAAEMSDRISRLLGAWAIMDDADLTTDLTALIGGTPSAENTDTARKLFARVLDVPGGLKIRTIHSFCESLIGRFPVEAGIAPHFSVIDERTTAELLNDAREHILAQSISDPDGDLAGALTHLAELVNEDDFTTLMQGLTGKRARLNEVVAHYKSQGGLSKAITKLVGLNVEDSDTDTILKTALKPGAIDELSLTRAANALLHGSPTSQKNAGKIKEFLNLKTDARICAFDKLYKTLFVTQKNEPASLTRTMTSKGARDFEPALEEIMLTEQDRVLDILEKIRARKTADATVSLLTVGQAMIETYEHLKGVRAYLDYDDLIDTARELLSTQGGVSWVHFKLDGGIDHILVDESQDTSPAQWDVVQSLATDFHSGLGRHEETNEKPRTVFAVGDEKQSIYSFQGADPLEFGRMREHFSVRATEGGQSFHKIQLIESFRTVEAVLRVVDRVFAQPGASEGLTFDGNFVTHKTYREKQAGLVELWPTFKPEPQEDVDPWDAPLDYKNHQSAELRLANKIADTVQGWIKDKEILTAENRP
ncbi:MAG: UvrD-helicase domain-containing protein, partial [Magnetovibrio sp.]|nr:UvrD-helicase domain-containing protein [Magnetovibrio sp.]